MKLCTRDSITEHADKLGFGTFTEAYRTTFRLRGPKGSTNRAVEVHWTSTGGVRSAEMYRHTSTTPDKTIDFSDAHKADVVLSWLNDIAAQPMATPKENKKATRRSSIASIATANGWELTDQQDIHERYKRGDTVLTISWADDDNGFRATAMRNWVAGAEMTRWSTLMTLLSSPTDAPRTELSADADPLRTKALTALAVLEEALDMSRPLTNPQMLLIRTVVRDTVDAEQKAAAGRLATYVGNMTKLLGNAADSNVVNWVRLEAAILQKAQELTVTADTRRLEATK